VVTSPESPAGLLAARLERDPARPFVTFYDDATGDRAELSTASFANWVSKTANLLVDGLGCAPSDTVSIALPRHWLAPVWALATWSAGLRVEVSPVDSPDADRLPVAVAVTAVRAGSDDSADIVAPHVEASDIVAVSLLPFGAPSPAGGLPAGVIDYARDVSGYGDRFSPQPSTPGDILVTGPGYSRTVTDVVADSAALSSSWHLRDGGRLLVAASLGRESELLAGSIIPLLAGGSVVLVANAAASPDRIEQLAELERVTAVAGPGR
jgi:uncharacterized protein (TIGR03089 family)